ncbi:MAG: hypothetical protein Q9195_004447 [Heterodermia aff. obscurata]
MGAESNPRLATPCLNVENPQCLSAATPTTFFIASEDNVEQSQSVADVDDSTFGVKSMESTTANEYSPAGEETAANGDSYEVDVARRRSTLKPRPRSRDIAPGILQTTLSPASGGSSPRKLYRSSPPSTSQSLASLSQVSLEPGSSLPSSPKSNSSRSLRPSDEESVYEGGSQAIASSEEDEAEMPSEFQGSSPQLIMPSIKMPSRRPFTVQGKEIGRLKVLIAGDIGVGKTSLIKSIVQTCEAIVHVDPLSPTASIEQLPPRKPKGSHGQDTATARTTDHITEVFASTRPYASWWSEIDDYRFFRRRKSVGDAVLERNLCFVDTPGYSRAMSTTEGIELVIQYIENQLAKTFSFANTSEGEIVSMMGGDGGSQVDLVLYMITQDIKPADLDFIRRLSAMTNVVLLIAKADLLTTEQVEASKTAMLRELEAAGIKPFTLLSDASQSPFYTVCSALSKDEENMDASLLMSPDYVQPLVHSELATLVQDIFTKDHVSRLRHLAAVKLLRHRTSSQPLPTSPLSPSPLNILQSSGLLSSFTTTTSPTTSQTLITQPRIASSYVQARIADHTQREEKLAQVRLAKWAGDLQRGLSNERARYEALARGERALWLTQRLGECVHEGSLLPAAGAPGPPQTWSADAATRSGLVDAGDPLGLLRWSEGVRRRGWIAFQIVGGFGVLGAVAVWMARNRAWEQLGVEGGDWWGRWREQVCWL